MPLELDHLFICTAAGAPEAEKLIEFGLHEGQPNRHPGQGTANRRFEFDNAMIELLWVSDPAEAQSEATKRTLLWERWRRRDADASPFGFCLRPADSKGTEPRPFPSWEYRPVYLQDPLFMCVGEAGVEEPMWFYLSFMRRSHHQDRFVEHPAGIREITGLTLITPMALSSEVSKIVVEGGFLTTRSGGTSLLEIEFDYNRRKHRVDFMPELPLVFQL